MSNSIVPSHRRVSLTAGILYLLTFVSLPNLALYNSVKGANYVVGPGPDTAWPSGDHCGPRRHRHRRRSVLRAQETERRTRAGPRRLPNPGGRHHLRRCGVPLVDRDLAEGWSWIRWAGHQPCACRPV